MHLKSILLTAVLVSLGFAGLRAEDVPEEVQDDVPREQVVGAWVAKFKVDEAKVRKMVTGQGLGDDEYDTVLARMKSQLEKTSISMTFNDDGSASTHVSGAKDGGKGGPGGRWEFIESDGNIVKLKYDKEDDKEDTITLEFDGRDRFSFHTNEFGPVPIEKVVFVRQKESKENSEME